MRALTQLALAVAALGVWAASADAAPSAVFHGKAGLLELPGGNDVSAEGKLQKRGGIGSFYNVKDSAGACGFQMWNYQMICAVSPDIMGPIDPTQGPSSDSACGRQICLEHEGRVAQCIVGDVCQGCGPSDLRMTPAVFSSVHFDLYQGSVEVKWSFCEGDSGARPMMVNLPATLSEDPDAVAASDLSRA